jgi:hypothetical protein
MVTVYKISTTFQDRLNKSNLITCLLNDHGGYAGSDVIPTEAWMCTNCVNPPAIRIRSSRSTDESPRCRRAKRPCLYAAPAHPNHPLSYTRFNKFPYPLEITVGGCHPSLRSYYSKWQPCNAIFFNLYTAHFCSVFTMNQQMHYSDSLLFHSPAPTCFDVCTSSSGNFLLCLLS